MYTKPSLELNQSVNIEELLQSIKNNPGDRTTDIVDIYCRLFHVLSDLLCTIRQSQEKPKSVKK